MDWKKIGLGMMLSWGLLFGSVSLVRAVEKTPFDSYYQNFYQVLPDGKTKVVHQVRLVNKVATIYVTEYSLTINHTNVKDIRVKYKNNWLKPKVERSDNQVIISFSFPDQVIGRDKERRFEIWYEDDDVAEKTGRVWEVNIPTLKEIENTKEYTIELQVPSNFPPVLTSSPKITNKNAPGLIWTKTDLLEENGVKVIFGDYQSLRFKLRYFIQNPTVKYAYYKIALPPDTDYQRVWYESIEPKPANIEVDKDGNWLAVYYLEPSETLEIIAKGKAWLFMKPWFNVSYYVTDKMDSWLSGNEVWQVEDKNIKELADSFRSIRQAYRYVVDRLEYSYKRALEGPDRLGAVGALKNPDLAVCMEYTDLFITLARAMGVPAREVNGYAYTDNSVLKPLSLQADVLHAWPEYYDFNLKRWRPVDPTWEDTTGGLDYFYSFDLNHFTFVIHGLNPYYPITPGAYKNQNNPQKDVEIKFESLKFDDKLYLPKIKVQENLEIDWLSFLSGFQGLKTVVELRNPYNVAVYVDNLNLSFADGSLKVKNQLPVRLILPPFSSYKYKIELSGGVGLKQIIKNGFVNKDQLIDYEVVFNQAKSYGQVRVGIKYWWLGWVLLGGGLFGIGGLIVFVIWKRKQ